MAHSEEGWYKAACYDSTAGAGGGDNYWTDAAQSDSVPTVATADVSGNVSNPGENVANYNFGADWNSQNGNVTTVRSAAANNYFGTADMNGNVWEWNDAVIGLSRGRRGGSWGSVSSALASSGRDGSLPTDESSNVGFRVASVPETSAVLLTFLAVAASLTRRRRDSL